MHTQQYFVFSNIAIFKQRFFKKIGVGVGWELAAVYITAMAG
jgi:hypothetical protein